MKYEWRKVEKQLYLPKTKPEIIAVPKLKYLTISGQGNPNEPGFQKHIEALYPIAYAIRMMPRNGYTPEGYFEYTVYPLEGLWSLTEKGQTMETLNKDEFVYTIMIRQPDFVTQDVFERAVEKAKSKQDNPLFDQVKFETIEDGLCVQMMHIGPYDDEPASFDTMHAFLEEEGYERTTLVHKEIYISDFRKVAPEKLKTVLRCFIRKRLRED